MGAGRAMVAVVVLFAVTSVAAQDAPAGAPSAGAGCLTALVNVSDCLTYVEEGSNLTAPARACCPELAGLVESNLTCLCELLGRADSLMVHINVSRMMDLPSACDISTPPSTLCSGNSKTSIQSYK
ncbi:hypothetical protein CDL15_Pgr025263 [Punica granatum]|uniref:Bifunctional inhibitor/plant lipid transfer protein/seed storage helical domain-containing protein n=1 Tax=Punica granatum TaxID=22663 RepID=A0A218W8V4_PUNGR|nr:hypothetical protein CDL15_Pgr025263 [Punica granatum]